MLEIKTIILPAAIPEQFDKEVNAHLKDGWDLVRREVIAPFEGDIETYKQKLYAELERVVDDPDIDEEISDDMATWIVSRNPKNPYKCSACGYTANEQWGSCPDCGRVMIKNEE
jgi:rubrerythrin